MRIWRMERSGLLGRVQSQNLVLEMSQNSLRCIESDQSTSSIKVTSCVLGSLGMLKVVVKNNATGLHCE